jgi:SAM-dependent methyltransferase
MEDKKFNSRKKKTLNNPNRFKFIPTDTIINALDLENPTNLVDYGAGTGYLTWPIADSYPKTRVFALDIEPLMIEDMEHNMECDNVYPLLINDNEIPFAENDIDAIWSIAVYHELNTPEIWLKNVLKALKPNGKLLIIDWSVNQDPSLKIGPPINHRIKEDSVIEALENINFKNIKLVDGFKNHFGIMAIK